MENTTENYGKQAAKNALYYIKYSTKYTCIVLYLAQAKLIISE